MPNALEITFISDSVGLRTSSHHTGRSPYLVIFSLGCRPALDCDGLAVAAAGDLTPIGVCVPASDVRPEESCRGDIGVSLRASVPTWAVGDDFLDGTFDSP